MPFIEAQRLAGSERAIVLIGVSSAGGFERLQAVDSSIEMMQRWARSQEIPEQQIVVISDATTNHVGPEQIKKVCFHLARSGTPIRQLIVYFSGHGLNNGGSEYWLLTDAPYDTNAAINVDGTKQLALRSPIPHVVLISDTCRTIAAEQQQQYLKSTDVFPNPPSASNKKNKVDVFYACKLGRESNEVRRRDENGAIGYSPVYTRALAHALNGNAQGIVDPVHFLGGGDDEVAFVVRPKPLDRWLQREVPFESSNQDPDAHVLSDDDAWLSRVRRSMHGETGRGIGSPPPSPPPQDSITAVVNDAIRAVASGRTAEAGRRLSEAKRTGMKDHDDVIGALQRVMEGDVEVEPSRLEGRAAFFSPDLCMAGAHTSRGPVVLSSAASEVVRIDEIFGAAANVLLVFEDGRGVVLPAVPHFSARLSFVDNELVDVFYQPELIEEGPGWSDGDTAVLERTDEGVSTQRRVMCAMLSRALWCGVSHLDDDVAERLTAMIVDSRYVDPSLSIYSAYPLFDRLRNADLSSISQRMRSELSMRFFDLALLMKPDERAGQTFPPFPLLSKGWALLDVLGAPLPGSLEGLEQHRLPSLWSIFNESGVNQIRRAMENGELI